MIQATQPKRFIDQILTDYQKEKEFEASDEQGLIVEEYDLGSHYVYFFICPGFIQEEVSIQVRDSELLVQGTRVFNLAGLPNQEKLKISRRAVFLPKDSDQESIQSLFDNGVLKVFVAKRI